MAKNQNPTDPRTAIKAALRDYSEADALRVLFGVVADYGREHYEADYQATVKQPELVGLGLAAVYGAQAVAEVAHAAWEDMNAHDANRWLTWYWPEICNTRYTVDLETLKRVIAKNAHVNIWENNGADMKIRGYNLKLSVEKETKA